MARSAKSMSGATRLKARHHVHEEPCQAARAHGHQGELRDSGVVATEIWHEVETEMMMEKTHLRIG